MSGHSKWNNIKRKKEATDGAKAKVFTKIGREIAVCVKEGGGDPNNNSKLRDLIAKAKSNNVPNDNIDRIIKKAMGDGDKTNYEANIYEGYGPCGVAVIVETLTDNKNRTAGDIRHYFDKFGGNLGTTGCVSFMFSEKGIVIVDNTGLDEDKVMEDIFDCGASDFTMDDDEIEIETEPSDVGADMTVGSLIKNPGGGLAPIGGYICGMKKCVDRCAYRLSAPGLGQEVGANLGLMPALYQGFFLAPTVVAGAEKGAIFAANLYEPLGFRCVPGAEESRHDIIQAVELGSEAGMVAFCKGIQAAAPVDSFATPYPSDMPGYNDKVIMAAGAFVQGSSIELSADGPIRPPYAVYFQGGLTWNHAKIGILMSLQKMADAGLVTL